MKRTPRPFALVVLLAAGFLLAGCGQARTVPPTEQSLPPTAKVHTLPPTATPEPTATATPRPTAAATRPPTATPLVVQPTPYAPEEALPAGFSPVLYALKRQGDPLQLWVLRYEQGMLEEELLVNFGSESLRDTFTALRWLLHGDLWELRLSPDGQYVAVTSFGPERGTAASAVVTVDGTLSLPVIPEVGVAGVLDWLPGTDKILVFHDMGKLYGTMRVDGTEIFRFPVTSEPISAVVDAIVSPDGQHLILSAPKTTLGMIPIDGSRLDSLPQPERKPSSSVGSFAWSPDGKQLAFTWAKGGLGYHEGQLWLMDPDGRNQRALGPDDTYDFAPTWSPDGTRLAFARMENPDEISSAWDPTALVSSLWIVDVESGEERLLLSSEGQYAHWSPAWLPDGTGLVFLSDRGGEANLWFVRPDGSGLQQLTRQGALVGFERAVVFLPR